MKVLLFLTIFCLLLTFLLLYLYMIYFNIKNYYSFTLRIKIINIIMCFLTLPIVFIINERIFDFLIFIFKII